MGRNFILRSLRTKGLCTDAHVHECVCACGCVDGTVRDSFFQVMFPRSKQIKVKISDSQIHPLLTCSQSTSHVSKKNRKMEIQSLTGMISGKQLIFRRNEEEEKKKNSPIHKNDLVSEKTKQKERKKPYEMETMNLWKNVSFSEYVRNNKKFFKDGSCKNRTKWNKSNALPAEMILSYISV